MIESRKEQRIPHSASLIFSVFGDSGQQLHLCDTVDISTSGLGIISDMPLQFGQFLEFASEMSTVPSVNGIVQWCSPVSGQYRAGLYLF